MALPLDQQEQALAQWLADPHVRDLLDGKQWTQAFATYTRIDLADAPTPWTPMRAGLRDAKFMLVSSSGLSSQGQQPFDDQNPLGDFSYRVQPADLDLGRTTIAHDHYDHSPAMRDRNTVFPLDRLRELAEVGEIGRLTERHVTFMGYLPDWRRVRDDLAPAIVDVVAAQHPDAVLLVPV